MKQNVGTAVFHNNSVLLAKRIIYYKGDLVNFPGYWSIFCGAVEDGETPIKAAYRELEEETGLPLKKGINFFTSFIFQDYEFLFHTLEVDDFFTPKLCFEHTESGWFDINSLVNFPYDIDDNIVRCIFEYNKIRDN